MPTAGSGGCSRQLAPVGQVAAESVDDLAKLHHADDRRVRRRVERLEVPLLEPLADRVVPGLSGR